MSDKEIKQYLKKVEIELKNNRNVKIIICDLYTGEKINNNSYKCSISNVK